MGLTRTRFIQADTALAKIQDPITVLNSDSTVANIDVGFLINRNGGIAANTAIYWSESGKEFVTALTSNNGIPNSNITVSSYANLRVGSVFGNIGGGNDQANVYITGSLLPTSNISFDIGSTDNRFKTLWLSGSTIVLGRETMSVNAAGEWIFTSGGNTVSIGTLYNFVGDNATTGNLTVTGQLSVTGNSYTITSNNISLVDSIIELHTQSNLAPLTSDDGRDIGLKFHYYKTKDEHAFLGWSNSTGYLEWYDSGREGVGNIFTGNTYGTVKTGELILSNTTAATSTTTGVLKVSGGVGIQGNLYVHNIGDVSSNIGLLATNINSINANIGSFQNYANANLSLQTTNISNIVIAANTNTAAYISTYTGNISAGNISVVSNIVVDHLFTTNGLYWYGNGTAFTNSIPSGFNRQVQFNDQGIFSGAQLEHFPGSGNLVSTTNTISTSTTTGGLVLKGGLGVAGNIFANGLNGQIYGTLYIGTTDVNYDRSNSALVLTGVGIDGTATTATTAINTQITSNVTSGLAYVSFVNSTSGNVEQNVNTALTYNPNSGNLRAYGIQTDTGIYWAGNGVAFSSGGSTYGNANVAAYLEEQNITSANIGAFQTFSNANAASQAISINTINANVGQFYNYANTKIGTNTNSNLVVVSTTNSTSATTGALVVAGGIGASGNVTFGGNTDITGKLRVNDDTDAVPYVMGSGAFHVVGGMSIGKDFWVGGNIYVANVISQTSTILQVSEPLVYLFPNSAVYNYDIGAFSEFSVGGVPKYTGVVRSVQTGEWVFFSNITNKPTSGSVGITSPEVIYEAVKVGNLVVANTTASINTTTGALIVRGGVGISGSMFVSNVTAGGITSNGTVQAATVNAATIGNSGATITGTIGTASQPNITTLGGLTSFGGSFGDTTAQGNLTVVGNLTVQGNTITIGSNNLTVTDSIIDLHTPANLSPLISDDGRDIGFRFHYYKGMDDHAFFGWENNTETLIYLQRSDETNSNITGTYGNVQFGSLLLSNTTAATSTTTGALQVLGGAGISGAVFTGGIIDATGNIIADSGTPSTSTTTGALVVNGGAGISGNVFTAGWIIPTSNISQNIGTSTQWFNTFFGVSTQARYADLAENYQADNYYEPGTVVSFGGSHEITIASVSHDSAIAGVVSTNPAHLMNGALTGVNVLPLALQGRVPCLVKGPVRKGTLLVSSDTPGVAQALVDNLFKPGCIIGKSLGTITDDSIQKIEVVIGRL